MGLCCYNARKLDKNDFLVRKQLRNINVLLGELQLLVNVCTSTPGDALMVGAK